MIGMISHTLGRDGKQEITSMGTVSHLFDGWEETMIWSCLQGIMGEVWADETLSSAKAVLGDFCFFAGKAHGELIRHEMERDGGSTVLVPRNAEWKKALEEERMADMENSWTWTVRYALKKEQHIFQKESLRQMANGLEPPYELQPLDQKIFAYCRANDWCRDWVSQYTDFAHFERLGLGAVVTVDGVPVAGASAYTRYRQGIEIQIDTKKEYRRKGLACAAASRLILDCLDRGLYPSWDAHNKMSLALAQKLGYHFDREYAVLVRNVRSSSP